ncbi:hypothetical protein [Mesorhizobium sp. M2A.F.Ca.ET.039.01.1.1]|uniref:hypothetical protein n=2 Tax=unclassified Mesorhizobium TaxID=325217 RepID=UPI0011AE73FF|nr:hypothetical protein [Mesorhizobium sp. M2A.F.Ca.ET.039.01.1.1]
MKQYRVLYDTWIRGSHYSQGFVIQLEEKDAEGFVGEGLLEEVKADDADANSDNISVGLPGQFEPPARTADAAVADKQAAEGNEGKADEGKAPAKPKAKAGK